MTISAVTTQSANAGIERYREAERRLWGYYGLEPIERFVEIEAPAVRLRVLEVGSGDPILFVHGTAGPGAWPPLVRELEGFRCLILDRPGWGLSSTVDYSQQDYGTLVAELLEATLEGLGVDRTHIVGASIGNTWALRLAAHRPARVDRLVLLGGAPLAPEVRVPPFIRLLATPAGAVIARIPEKPKMVRAQLRQLGHGASVDAGRIPDEFVQWHVAATRERGAMRHEREMVRAVASPRGFRPGLVFQHAELGAIRTPTLYVYGTEDPVADIEIVESVVGALPQGELHLAEGAGHVTWLDDPAAVGGRVRGFLTQPREPLWTRSGRPASALVRKKYASDAGG